MKPAPTSPLIVPQALLLLQLFVIPLNDPSLLGRRHQCRQPGIRGEASQPVLRRFGLFRRPFDQQPLLRQRFTPLIIPIRRPDTHCRETGLQPLLCAIAPPNNLPFLGGECSRQILGQIARPALPEAAKANAPASRPTPTRRTLRARLTPTSPFSPLSSSPCQCHPVNPTVAIVWPTRRRRNPTQKRRRQPRCGPGRYCCAASVPSTCHPELFST